MVEVFSVDLPPLHGKHVDEAIIHVLVHGVEIRLAILPPVVVIDKHRGIDPRQEAEGRE